MYNKTLEKCTIQFLFEALAEHDLRIYANHLDGALHHFRDGASGDEVDAILEFADGQYAAIEIKLSSNAIPEALSGLSRFASNVEKKPAFMCVVVGVLDAAYRDPATGIYVVPLTSLTA